MNILWHKYRSTEKSGSKYTKWRSSICSSILTLTVLGATLNAHAVTLIDMKNNMTADLEGKTNGYAFVIKRGAKQSTGAGGLALRPADIPGGGSLAMTTDTRSFIASVTKTISAIAILQLLEANSMPITAKVAPWFPDDWVIGPGFDQLTFKDLLTHETGLNQIFQGLSGAEKVNWKNDWDGMKWVVENGAIPNASSSYKNMNYVFSTVLIPALWKASGASDATFTGLTEGNRGLLYVWYVTNHIFKPSGVAVGASCTASEFYAAQAMAYDVDLPRQEGHMSETSWPNCGGHTGLRLSAQDLAKIMQALVDGKLLSSGYRFAMNWFRLGWNKLSSTNSNGRKNKWWHGGDWFTAGDREYHACVMTYYPEKIAASLVVNSRIAGKGACTILKDAYNNAQ